MIDEPQIILELPGSLVVNCISVFLVTLYNELRLKVFSTSVQLYCILRFVYLSSPFLSRSIQSKKGKSGFSQREVYVIMPNEQCVAVKCDIKSRGRDVFDMVVAHANLVEHFYFGLAFIDGNVVFNTICYLLCVLLMTER